MGGENRHGNGSRRRQAARGAEMSGGRWRVAGVGDVQVDSALRQERMWGAVVTEKYEKKEMLLMGGR